MPRWKEADPEQSAAGRNEIRSGVRFWTPPSGEGSKPWKTSRVRIMPPHEDNTDNKYYHWIAVHGNLPGSDRPVRCPAKNDNYTCPACEEGNRLWNLGDKDKARKFFASWRAFVNVIVLTADGDIPEDATIQVWGIAKTTLDDLEAKIGELDKGERNIASPTEAGRDIFVRRRGKGAEDTKYEIAPAPQQSAFPDMDKLEELMEEGLYLLPEIYPVIEQTHITALLSPAKPRHVDPFEDEEEEEEDVIEGVFTTTESAKVTSPFGDDEEDNGEDEDTEMAPQKVKPTPALAKGVKSSAASARERLLARMES